MPLVEGVVYFFILCLHYPFKFLKSGSQLLTNTALRILSIPGYIIGILLWSAIAIKLSLARGIEEIRFLFQKTTAHWYQFLMQLIFSNLVSTDRNGDKAHVHEKNLINLFLLLPLTLKTKQEEWFNSIYETLRNNLMYLLNFQPYEIRKRDEIKDEPKPNYEQTFVKFQVHAFDQERQKYHQQIHELKEELQRVLRRYNSVHKESQKCDKQILDMQEQLNRYRMSFTQQKQHLITEFEKERHSSKQESTKLQQKMAQTQINNEQLAKQCAALEAERKQHQQDKQNLSEQIKLYKTEIQELKGLLPVPHQGGNQREENCNNEEETQKNSYVTDSLHTIDTIRAEANEYKKRITAFRGTPEDKEFLNINEMLIRNMIKLDNIESQGNNTIRKRRKSVLQFLQKCQEDLKCKASTS